MKIYIRKKLSGIEHPLTQYQHALNIYIQAYITTISIQKKLQAYSEQSKHFKNVENIPLVDEGDAQEEVEMKKMQMNQKEITKTTITV